MSAAAAKEIATLIPKLRPDERTAIRSLLDEVDYDQWREDTTKFRRLIQGKAKDVRPASTVVSEMRR